MLVDSASHYPVLLNSVVSIDNTIRERGGFSEIRCGILSVDDRLPGIVQRACNVWGNRVAIKTPHGGPPGDSEIIKVFQSSYYGFL